MEVVHQYLPWVFEVYKWGILLVGAATFVNAEGTVKERALTAVLSGLAWPVVVYRHVTKSED